MKKNKKHGRKDTYREQHRQDRKAIIYVIRCMKWVASYLLDSLLPLKKNNYTYKEADNRCQFIFDGKPDEETRRILKSNAFKWSPSRTAWVRQLTGNGRFAARYVMKALDE